MTAFLVNFKKSNLPENQGIPLYDYLISDEKHNVVLPADTVVSLTVPVGAIQAVVQSTDDFFVGTSTFTLPSSATFVVGEMELNPFPLLRVEGVTTLFFRAVGTPTITMAFYTE